MSEDGPDVGVELVNVTTGLDPRVVLRDPVPVGSRGLAPVAVAGVDRGQVHVHGRLRCMKYVVGRRVVGQVERR